MKKDKSRSKLKTQRDQPPAPFEPALCLIDAVNAIDAGEALMTVARRLGEARVLTSEGARILEAQGRRIKQSQKPSEWTMLIDPDERVKFEWIEDKNGQPVQPWLCANLVVDQSLAGRPPFSVLDIAIQFDDLHDAPVGRWHVDLANEKDDEFQPGPLFHLQFGGHQQGFRERDHPLKAPRWCHPPIEAALVCEVIAANFFEDKWLALREDPGWCAAIAQFQRLCYPAYLNKLAEALLKPRSTLLNEVWAGDWDKSARCASDQVSGARAC